MEHAEHDAWQMKHAEYIIEQLKRVLEVRGMKVAELARRSMIPEKQLGKVFRRERLLKADEQVRLCYALEVGIAWLIPPELECELAALNKRKPGGAKGRR